MGESAVFSVIFAAMNAVSFAVCGYDKFAAKRGNRRVPEKTLLVLAALFGSVGMLAGMYLFRHKTRHKKFTVTVPVLIILHLVIIYFAIGDNEAKFLLNDIMRIF